jgi:hypothetical protein
MEFQAMAGGELSKLVVALSRDRNFLQVNGMPQKSTDEMEKIR